MSEHHQLGVSNLDLVELFNKYLRWGIVKPQICTALEAEKFKIKILAEVVSGRSLIFKMTPPVCPHTAE